MNRRAAAIVACPYNHDSAASTEAAIAYARETGLGLAMPDDYPAWYHPGQTVLKVWLGVAGRTTYGGEVLVEPDPAVAAIVFGVKERR